MYCLDTNVVIATTTGRSRQVTTRLDAEITARQRIFIPAIVVFELRYGAAKSQRAAENFRRLADFLSFGVSIIAFDDDDATHAGAIRAHLERQGTPIGPYDILIAAQTRRRGLTLVTANRREFEQVPGLMVQDWSR